MNDEIKEILISLSSQCKSATGCENSYFKVKYIQQLLDYITNLQQENERLKERVAYLERSNNRREDTIIGLRFEVAEQEDYKSRCEKAVEQAKEKIKGYKETIDMLITTSVENKRYEIAELRYRIREQEDLLNILQNGSEKEWK